MAPTTDVIFPIIHIWSFMSMRNSYRLGFGICYKLELQHFLKLSTISSATQCYEYRRLMIVLASITI